jgi:hypothetical protein
VRREKTTGNCGRRLRCSRDRYRGYTGTANAYNLGGILGASFAPSLAQILESTGGIPAVGAYIAGAAVISFLAIFSMREARHDAAA